MERPAALRVVFAAAAMWAACLSAFAQNQPDNDAWRRFVSSYADVFFFIQQERNCCATGGDPLALWEASIDRVIAKFRSVDASGIQPEIAKVWINVRDKHIAAQEVERQKVKLIAKVRAETPGFRVYLFRDPRPTLPPSRVAQWDAIIAAEGRAGSQMNASVAEMDKAVETYGPKR